MTCTSGGGRLAFVVRFIASLASSITSKLTLVSISLIRTGMRRWMPVVATFLRFSIASHAAQNASAHHGSGRYDRSILYVS